MANKLKKKQQINFKQKKVKAQPDEWIGIIKAIVKAKRKDLSAMRRIWATITRKEQKDVEREICKEIIQRMDQKKMPYEEAQQMALSSAQTLQELQKELPRIVIYLLGGGIMLLTSIIFFIIRSPKSLNWQDWTTDFSPLIWLTLIAVNLFIFIIGLKKRKTFEQTLIVNSVLSQASAAYASGKAPGRGGSLFEAYRYLDLIREKNKSAFNEKFKFGGKGKK